MKPKPTLYSHQYKINFIVISDQVDASTISDQQIVDAIRDRARQIERETLEHIYIEHESVYPILPSDYDYEDNQRVFELQSRVAELHREFGEKLNQAIAAEIGDILQSVVRSEAA